MVAIVKNPHLKEQGIGGNAGQDKVRITKGELRFNALTIKRVNTVPSAYDGRPGDIIIVDDTDSQDPTGLGRNQHARIPTSVGLWLKQPLSYSTSPVGTVIIGFPGHGAISGDVLDINGIPVTFTAPFTVKQAATNINGSSIPNINAYVIGDALVVKDATSGAINMNNVTGDPLFHLGLYSSEGFGVNPPNGAWIPIADVATGNNPSAASNGSIITSQNEPSLSNSRTLASSTGIVILDNGSGSTLEVKQDIAGVPLITETVDDLDSFLLHNDSTGNIERIDIKDFGSKVLGTKSTLTSSAPVAISNGSHPIGSPIDIGFTIVRMFLEIQVPFNIGATITIGTSTFPALLMASSANDPTTAGTYNNYPFYDVTALTQVQMFISGRTTGQARVFFEVMKLA